MPGQRLNKIPILMYHSISDDKNHLSVSIKSFSAQMRLMFFLGYKTITFSEIHKFRKLKKKFIVTFDDGYKDNLTNALPILNKYNFKSISFVVVDLIGKFNKWDQNRKGYKKKKLMCVNDLKLWIKNKQKIGSHSLSHSNLQKSNLNKKIKEIELSKKKIQKILNTEIDSFSFPYGRYDRKTLEIAKKNYKFCVTTSRSRFNNIFHNRFLMPRVHINPNTNLFKFILKMFTFYEDLKYRRYCKFFK